MASDKNSPQKGQSSNKPDFQQSTESDAADLDWMIISDLSTRMGGSTQLTTESKRQASKASEESDKQILNDDLEDLEWLRSLDLDEPIERSPAQKNISGSVDSNSDVGNIDWLIVTDLKTRMDDSEIKAKTNPQYQGATQPKTILQSTTPIDSLTNNILEDDLGLEGLEFLENSDFSDLDSLGFSSSDDFGADDLLNETDITEGKIQELSEFLDDNFESNSSVNDSVNDNDWESILGVSENSSESGIPSEIPEIEIPEIEIPEIISSDADEYDNYDNKDVVSEQLIGQLDKPIYQEDPQENLINNFDFPVEDFDNSLNDGFGEVQPLQSLDSSMLGDEIWASSSPSTESEGFNQSTDDIFINDWESIAENSIDDPIWDSPASIDPNLISPSSIDNAFDTFDQQPIAPQIEYFELEEDVDFELPNEENINLAINQADLAIASDFETGFEQDDFEQDNYADWSVDLEAEIGKGSDVVWNDELVAPEDYLESIDNQQFTESDSLNDYEFNPARNALESEIATDDWNANHPEISDPDIADLDIIINSSADDTDEIESIINANFDLATFDEDNFPEIPLTQNISNTITTTLSPNRAIAIPSPQDSLLLPVIEPIDDLPPANDLFEESLASDLLSDDYNAEIDFIEEALAYDLLNDYPVEVVDNYTLKSQIPSPPPANLASNFVPNLAPSSNFEMPDSDFLDDFDLDSVGSQIASDDFDSGFSAISTSLTSLPAPVPPPITQQEPTSTTVNSPPPPPFLLPLPPRRSSNQTKASTLPPTLPPSISKNSTPYSQSQNRIGESIGEDDFDGFHNQQNQIQQNESRSLINSIDKGWSELLNADTVISGVLRSPVESSSLDTSDFVSPPVGRASQSREQSASRNIPKRKENKLHDFDELGLEIHDDNTDWSGLLDSGDLSDSITTISHQSNQSPPRIRGNQTTSSRLDATGINETREMPRDRRRPMASFGDATQARMTARPDQMDFNRFTEDSYDSYEPVRTSPEVAPSKPIKPNITMPSVSLESLWQDYLKIPALGLGAIGGAFLLYTLLNRPVFDLGLRWGLFKDASGKDFTNADFKGAKLDNVDFSKAILTGAKMQDTSLVGANFQEANLDGVNFTKANLSRARFIKASVIWAEFNNAQMNLVDLEGADLTRSNFGNAKMEGVNLKGSKIGDQGTEKATKFSSTILLSWQIVNEPKEGRNLKEQNLSGLNLSFTSLKRANLSNSKLNYADMTGTDLSGANLTEGQVNGANWSGAKLNGINLTGVIFDKNKLPKTDEETICPNAKKGPCKF
jgi:uncharacterized protein YjbI with pentapeptide repeats